MTDNLQPFPRPLGVPLTEQERALVERMQERIDRALTGRDRSAIARRIQAAIAAEPVDSRIQFARVLDGAA